MLTRRMGRAALGTAIALTLMAADVAAAAPPHRERPRLERDDQRQRDERPEPRRSADIGTWRTQPRHDISIKIGAYPYTMYGGHLGLAGTYTALFGPYGYATPDALAALRVRQTPYKTFGGITAAYYYRVASILSVGVALTYAGLYGDILDAVTRRKIASDNTTTLSASAALRLQWLNRPLVRCYSSLAMGPAVDIRSLNHSREGYITLSATIAGVSVGRRLYGFGEIGAGAQGIFSAGIGYRF